LLPLFPGQLAGRALVRIAQEGCGAGKLAPQKRQQAAALQSIPTGSFRKDHQNTHKQRMQRLPEGPENLGWYNEA